VYRLLSHLVSLEITTPDVEASVAFYRRLLGLDVVVDHGWYAELGAGGRTVLAVVASGHATVPPEAVAPARGVLVTFEVDDAGAVADVAGQMYAPIRWPLTVELGQRHVMVSDPDGTIVDVVERVPMSAGDVRRLAGYRRLARTAPGC
jgi:catechol 2,3-dioxygenase-like lactoylglutathione lyase family enzyme